MKRNERVNRNKGTREAGRWTGAGTGMWIKMNKRMIRNR